MSETRVSNPLIAQFRRGGIPRELRLMAAQGALPLKPEDLVELLHFLVEDEDSDVAGGAHATLAAMPAAELLPVLKDRQTPAGILGWGLANRLERELREAVLQNPSTPDEAIEAEVAELPEDLAELVVINQVRLLRRTTLLEHLEANPHLNRDQQRRLRELRESFHIGDVAPAEMPAPPPAPAVSAPAAAPAPESETPAEPVALESEITSEVDAMFRYLTEEERQEAERISTVQRIYRLNTAEKIITALKGSREERAVLVRDPNRLVSSAVLGSPKMTDAEVEAFAGMRNISDEVLRQIGNNREWTKRYGVVASLVKNPRTPLGVSLGMVSRLNPRDIKGLATDRNVPEVLRRQAQKFIQAQQPKTEQKKH
jgi:hypothetical protein